MLKLFVCLLAMAATLYISVMYTPIWLMNVLFIEVILVISGFLLCLYFRKRIDITLKTSSLLVEKGKQAKVYLRIDNRSRLPMTFIKAVVHIEQDGGAIRKMAVNTVADRRRSVEIPVDIQPECCGSIKLTVKKLIVSDYFRLLDVGKKLNYSTEILVLPRLLPANLEVVSNFRYFIGDSDVYADDRAGDDPSQVFEIRNYRPGDKMQKIHWKLSAKSEDLIVRDYSEPVGYAIVLFVNFYRESGRADAVLKDAAAEAAASLSWTLTGLEYSHIVSWIDDKGRVVRFKISDFDDIYEMLARLLKAPVHTFSRPPQKLYGEKYGTASYHTLIEINMTPEIRKQGVTAAVLEPDRLEESLLKMQLEI